MSRYLVQPFRILLKMIQTWYQVRWNSESGRAGQSSDPQIYWCQYPREVNKFKPLDMSWLDIHARDTHYYLKDSPHLPHQNSQHLSSRNADYRQPHVLELAMLSPGVKYYYLHVLESQSGMPIKLPGMATQNLLSTSPKHGPKAIISFYSIIIKALYIYNGNSE